MLEFKLYFFDKVQKKMSYKQLDMIVTVLESYIFAKDGSGKFSLLAY